ncbi:MAG TPA: MBL fold metallo-hydrolase [Vicinamibacterales bacterium]|jgi:glyoxylase-like metal-dependent hydrolase (beta-lactamase superfamily II)
MSKKTLAILSIVAAAFGVVTITLGGQGLSQELQLVTRAAEALGGRGRLLALKSLQIVGYGELAYFSGGGNITGDPDAPQKWQKVLEYTRTIDLEHWRTRVQQRVKMDFVFAATAMQLGLVRTNEVLDGDIAYNVGGGGFGAPPTGPPQPQRTSDAAARQRRIELLAHPVTIVRAALDPATTLRNLRRQGNLQLVDVTIRQGDTLTLAVSATTNLPAWVSYVGPHGNLGDLTYRTSFVGYVPEKGIQLPTGMATTLDWRDVVQSKLYVDRNIVDAPVDDMSAPESVRTARQPQGAPGGGPASFQPIKVADHVWFMNGNTFFEFDDHLTMVEANRPDAALQAVLKVANALVPGKRVTEVIQTHHHFDHSAGLRAAVAEDLTIISRRGNEGIFREMASRPAKLFPDALGRNPRPLKFIPVDDHLKLKDSTNEVDIYHIVGNYHMADAVLIHVPEPHLLVEADLTTQSWDFNWWGDSLMNNIEHRRIKVDTNLSVHAQKPFPLSEVVSAIERQVRNAQALCRRAAEAQFFQPGCPVQYNRPLPPASE